MATVTTSSFLNLNWSDLLKGAILAAITTPVTIILESLNAGSLVFDWKHIGTIALAGFLSYIVKNLLSPASIKITDVPKETVAAVKEGEVKAVVIPTNAQIIHPTV
jgi:hypothetical protein